MAYYKVPQDVEAEDKLVFGLTLKQFIFAIIAAVSGFLAWQLGQLNILLAGLFLPLFLVFGFLTIYRPKDQPAETKIVAYINFWFQPRRRIWSRDGQLEHVHIQAPKRPPQQMLVRDKTQVRSQLKNLAQIVDTRGWSVKQASIQSPTIGVGMIDRDDRLIGPQDIQITNQPMATEPEAFDVMDETISPLAQNFARMGAVAEEKAHKAALDTIRRAKVEPTPVHEDPKISQVHSYGSTAEETTSTPLTPHFNPYPAGIRQKELVKKASSHQSVAKLAEANDVPVSVIQHQADRLANEDEIAFDIKH